MSTSFSTALFWIAATVAIVAQLAVLRSSLLGRTPGTDAPGKTHSKEIPWAVLPALMLAVTLYFSWQAVRASQEPAEATQLPAPRSHPLPAPSSPIPGSS